MYNNQSSSSYLDAGFNRFFSRSINSDQRTSDLSTLSRNAPNMTLNFDQMQTSGSLGDKIQVGGITIDGTKRRIVIKDEGGVEVGWIGNLDA